MQTEVGVRKPRAGQSAGPHTCWLLYHHWANHFSSQANLKSELYNKWVPSVSCSELETPRGWLLRAAQPRPDLLGSPFHGLVCCLSQYKASPSSPQQTRAASAQQGLQRGSFPPLSCSGGLIKTKPVLLRKHNHQTCGCPRAQQSCP